MELAQVIVFLLFYPLRQGAPTTYTSGAYTSGAYTGTPIWAGNTHPPTGSWRYSTSSVPLTTTEEVERTTYPPSSEPWYLADDEEIVTDWVELDWGTRNSEDAHDAFDDEINTSITLDPIIYGNVVKMSAVFYWPTVNVKGVRIVVDPRTDEQSITVELDPDFTDLFHSTLHPRTVCLLVSSNPSWSGVKTLEYKCDRVSATRVWIILKHGGGPNTVVHDVYMYGYSSVPEVSTYRKLGSEEPSEEAWVLDDNEEIVTDWVKLRWGYYNEKDAYEAFDDNEETSITMDPAIHGHVAKLYAVFYYQVNVKGVGILVDQWTDEDAITVEIDPEFTDFTATPRPRTVCPLKYSVISKHGLNQLLFKCDRITTARVWVIFKLTGGHSTVVHDVYMYGNSLSEYVTYEKEEEEGTEFVTGGMELEEFSTKYWMRTLSSTSYSQWPSGKYNTESTMSVDTGPTTSWPYFQFSDVFSLFQKEDNDYVTWLPDFEDFIPYEKLVEQQEKKVEKQLKSEEKGEEEEVETGSNVLGFLTNTGYLDYVLTENKVEDKVDEAKKTAKKDSDKKKDTGLLVDSNDVKNSIKVFQKFNGFPETGTLDRDILEFVKKPRCGNHDVEYTEEEVKQEALLCDTAFSGSKPIQTTNFDCEGFNGAGSETKCVYLPAVSKTGFIEEGVPYTIEIDLQFKPQEGGSWEDLKNKFHIFFNYDGIDELKFLDRINLFAENDKFGFLYDKKKAGKDKTLDDYDMTKTQIARREFKIRIDVEKNKEAFLLINGNDVGKIKYKRRLKPSVRLQWQDKVPGIITARICKRPETAEVSRRKRSASSHIWGGNLITFNFQNYSSSLGVEDTRKGVIEALKILGTSAKLEFKEISPFDSAMVTYMFIKGRHADGMTFNGAGVEKAHAFSPVHSEVHFNDFEKFTLQMEDRATSMFYVALHETGHALGMKHSEYKDAVMAAGYVPFKAYHTESLHRTDKQVLHANYLGDIPEQAIVIELEPAKRPIPDPDMYLPKFPLPRDCFDKIDAAFTFGPTLYLISNTFIWEYQKEGAGYQMMGGPQGVSNVLSGWNHITRAAFTVGDKLYILGDGVAHRYSRYSTIWVLKTVSTVDELLNSKTSSHHFGTVKSAFSLPLDGGVVQTTLVTGTQEYYKITWKNSNKVATAEWFQDSSGTELLGKTYGLTEFNAATAHEREKKGVKFTEVMKFDGKYVKSVKVYHKSGEVVRKKDPYFEIPVAFQIPKWCAPKLNG